MRLATSLVLSLSLFTGACFPHSAQQRKVAKIAEGGLAVAGIVLLSGVGAPADCPTVSPGIRDAQCEANANLYGNLGFGLILAGLLGFAITVSAEEDDSEPLIAPAAPEHGGFAATRE